MAAEKEPEGADEDLVEVYRTGTVMEANRALVEVLTDIIAFRRDRTSHALPAPDSEAGGYFIAVAQRHADEARGLLRQALEDGVLDEKDGRVID